MQGELCRYGNLVITSSSLHSPSRLLLPTILLPRASIWKRPLVGGRGGGKAAAAGKPGQSFPQIEFAVPVITRIEMHVYFILTVSEFAF